MRRQDKADRIGEILDELYPTPPIPLDHTDPYTLLVAVALSAQTTDKKVNEITPALFAEAGTPEAMAGLGEVRILELIRQIGLAPTKAKNLWLMANQILDAGGEIIPDWDFLESLAGVGHKTAGVVMAQAFDVPAFPVDTHIHRLAARWGLSNGTNVERTERDLKAVFPVDTWNRRHLQIIFFGREYCPARHHDLLGCEICSWAATKKRIAEEASRGLSRSLVRARSGDRGRRRGRRHAPGRRGLRRGARFPRGGVRRRGRPRPTPGCRYGRTTRCAATARR